MELNSKKLGTVAIVFVLFAVITVSGCIGNGIPDTTEQTPGSEGAEEGSTPGEGSTASDITSVDVTISKYKVGDLEGGVRIRARNLNAETPDFRIDETNGDSVITYLQDEKVGYIYNPDQGKWIEYSGMIAEQVSQSYASSAESAYNWAKEYGAGETATISVGDETGEVTINAVNPSLSDDIFTPPEGAEVEEVAMPQT